MTKYFHWISIALLLSLAVLGVAACGSQPAAGQGAKAPADTINGPRIAVESDSFDFGKVPLDKAVSHSFRIKNVGSEPLVIAGKPVVRAVQGC